MQDLSTTQRNVRILVFVIVFLGCAWFFQGAGENQNAHFSTVRALAERGTFNISEFANSTRDVVRRGDAVFSNKLPGLAMLGVIIYWPAQAIEQGLFDADLDAHSIRILNFYLVTLLCSALPAACAAVILLGMLLRRQLTTRCAAYTSLAFAFGTLMFPFAGVLMVHVLVAMSILAAWALLSSREDPATHALWAGAAMGVAVGVDHLSVVVVVLFGGFMIWEQRSIRAMACFSIGPILAILGLLFYRSVVLEGPMDTGVADETAEFVDQDLLFGVFDWPDPLRLYWLSFHPFRGLFYCCPVLLLALVGMFHVRRRLLDARRMVPLLVIGWYLLFNLSFNGWTGGVGVGPRYLIPTIPFLFLFVADAVPRHPKFSLGLALISVFFMFAVTAVRLIHPWANNFGPPLDENPVARSVERLLLGDVARNVDSFNLGLAMGLHGPWSYLILLALLTPPLYLLHRSTAPSPAGNVEAR